MPYYVRKVKKSLVEHALTTIVISTLQSFERVSILCYVARNIILFGFLYISVVHLVMWANDASSAIARNLWWLVAQMDRVSR